MTVIGLLGGASPLAASALYEAILAKAIEADLAGSLRLLLDHDGALGEIRTGGDGVALGVALKRSAARLVKGGANLIVTPVAAWHRPLGAVCAELSVPFLSMAEVAKARVVALELHTVGLLAGDEVVEDRLFAEAFAAAGADTVIPNAAGRRLVDRCLDAANARVGTSRDLEDLFAVVEALRVAGAERIVLGTAELSLLLGRARLSGGDIDPLDLLAEAVVEVIGQRRRKSRPLFPEAPAVFAGNMPAVETAAPSDSAAPPAERADDDPDISYLP